ncbi:endonuclease/exonuclease/phosphatase family protein [Erwinia sp. S43]|uniref:endonuclease/exonuclease/phosphatase family protein n=1 Tax=Erwinia sp. S43 TaxID=2769339 RepID=UPI00190934C1|nr:endonuclease/exonuclease/phosphatase family protein [Erwinia sp. S43]MBK0032701.1 endonuclease/exonuclease/phosphatase family protein [Erwinia sp. S43]
MTEKNTDTLTFAWWNTSLSPHSQENSSSNEHKSFAIHIVANLILEKNVDVLCLCEVANPDIELLRVMFIGSDFSIYDGTLRDGRKRFDLCIIYRSSVLELINSEIISKNQVSRKIHAGQEIDFSIKSTKENLTLYLVHWSSRLYDYEGSPKKILLGSLLRDAVIASMETRNIKNIIILGDFNEEPFNHSLTDGLFASRDIFMVRKKPNLLYNPFWRHMVYSNPHPYNQELRGCGTYYYKNNESCYWRTFDQIIFSSKFVHGGNWFLNESKTEIYYDEELMKLVMSSKSKFDHLPVISSIERTL